MKIIERGPEIDSTVYRETCDFCKSTIEFEGREARNHLGALGLPYKTVDCPVCFVTIMAHVKFGEAVPA